MSPYTPSGYGFTPTPHTMGYDISGPTDYVDSTTFDPRQTPIDPLPDSNNLVSPVVSTGKCHPHRIECLLLFFLSSTAETSSGVLCKEIPADSGGFVMLRNDSGFRLSSIPHLNSVRVT